MPSRVNNKIHPNPSKILINSKNAKYHLLNKALMEFTAMDARNQLLVYVINVKHVQIMIYVIPAIRL